MCDQMDTRDTYKISCFHNHKLPTVINFAVCIYHQLETNLSYIVPAEFSQYIHMPESLVNNHEPHTKALGNNSILIEKSEGLTLPLPVLGPSSALEGETSFC